MFIFEAAFKNDVQFSLIKALYTRLPVNSSTNMRVELNDHAHIVSRNEQTVTTVFSRKQSFNPSGLFETVVEYEVVWNIIDFNVIREEDDSSILSTILEVRKDFINSVIYSRISMLISEMTSSIGMPPIITPAAFQEKN